MMWFKTDFGGPRVRLWEYFDLGASTVALIPLLEL